VSFVGNENAESSAASSHAVSTFVTMIRRRALLAAKGWMTRVEPHPQALTGNKRRMISAQEGPFV